MKKQMMLTLVVGMLTASLILLTSFRLKSHDVNEDHSSAFGSGDSLKKEVLQILDTKCNVCHRKQNPFMVFKQKNMERRAKKIYRMVFIERTMPKGNVIRLANEEYNTLKKWLLTQNMF